MPSGIGATGLSDLLLRAAEPANERIVGDTAREAVASLRGYAYQVYASALAWLELPPGSELHLEVAEDFAVAAAGSLRAVQVKYTQDTISLASKQARDAISAFVKLTGDNPGRTVRLTLLTISPITTERRREHRTGDVSGIERWRLPDMHLIAEGSFFIRAIGTILERGEPLILTGPTGSRRGFRDPRPGDGRTRP